MSARTTASASSRPRRVSTIAAVDRRGTVDEPVRDEGRDGMPTLAEQFRDRQALTDAGAQQHALECSCRGIRPFAPRRGRLADGQPLRIRGGVLHVPEAHARDVTVRARTESPPVRALPVRQVVARPVGVVARPVGHLVPLVAGAPEEVVGQLVHVGLQVVVGRRDLAAADLPRELRAVLDDQRVRRHVVGLERDRGLQRCAPVLERLPRRAVDQVDADVEPRPSGGRDGRGDIGRLVRAIEHRENVRRLRTACRSTAASRRMPPARRRPHRSPCRGWPRR